MSDQGVSERLSADQLLKAVPGASFLKYPDIARFHSVDDLLATSQIQVVFVLYLTAENSGHWTVLFRRSDGVIEFFDPYGIAVDNELSFVAPDARVALKETTPLILSLLVKSGQHEKWTWNKYDLQSDDPRYQTCGRWAILRALHRDMNDEQFHAFIKKEAQKDKGNFDFTAVRLTDPLL